MNRGMERGDALLIVDVQNDLCPGGAVAVADGDRVVPVLNRWLEAAKASGGVVVASRDWHPEGHPSFRKAGGVVLPHCVQDSRGAAFHPALALPPHTLVVSKGVHFGKDQLSAFDETGLEVALQELGVQRVFIGGLPLEDCVRATALDAARLGFRSYLIAAASRPREPRLEPIVWRELERAGVAVLRQEMELRA